MGTNRKQRRVERQIAYRAGYADVLRPRHEWPRLGRGWWRGSAYNHGYEQALWDTGWFAQMAEKHDWLRGIERGHIPNYGVALPPSRRPYGGHER